MADQRRGRVAHAAEVDHTDVEGPVLAQRGRGLQLRQRIGRRVGADQRQPPVLQIGRQTLDLALVDDHRVHHGVTAVEAIDASQPAWRDVLVVTFKADD
ncbi:MAG: 2OG-Fe dioxygenase family protein [Xanthomonadales bacterium]|nr:2OG-Fe dioxygenase family protein [Xanthomonadales bacterium]